MNKELRELGAVFVARTRLMVAELAADFTKADQAMQSKVIGQVDEIFALFCNLAIDEV